MPSEASYKYLKLTNKKETFSYEGYNWNAVGKIVKLDSKDVRGILVVLLNNGVFIKATEEEYNAQ